MDVDRPRDSFLSEFGYLAPNLSEDPAFSPEYYTSAVPLTPKAGAAIKEEADEEGGEDGNRPLSDGTAAVSWVDSGYGKSPRTSGSSAASSTVTLSSPRTSSLPKNQSPTPPRPSTTAPTSKRASIRPEPQLSAPFWESNIPDRRAIRKSLERQKAQHQSSQSVATVRLKRSVSSGFKSMRVPPGTPPLSASTADLGQANGGGSPHSPTLKSRASYLLASSRASMRSFGSPTLGDQKGEALSTLGGGKKDSAEVVLSGLPPVIPMSDISSGDPITLDLFEDPCAPSTPTTSSHHTSGVDSLRSPWVQASAQTGEMSKEQTEAVEMDEEERIREAERKMQVFEAERKLEGLGIGVGVEEKKAAETAEGEAEGEEGKAASSANGTPFVTPQTATTAEFPSNSPLKNQVDPDAAPPTQPAAPPPPQPSRVAALSGKPNVLRSLSSMMRVAPRPPKVPRIDPELPFHPTKPPTQKDLKNALGCRIVDPEGRSLTFGSLFPPPPQPSSGRNSTRGRSSSIHSSAASIRSRLSSRSQPSHGYPTKGPLVLIFIRFFNCGYCQEYASQLSRIFARGTAARQALSDSHVRVAIVGTGSWKMLKAWKEVVGWEGMAFTDPSADKNLFRALGMVRKTLSMGKTSEKGEYLSHLSVTQMAVNSMVNGAKMPLKNPGSLLQLGGEFCFDTVESLERSDPAALLRLNIAETAATEDPEGTIKNHYGLQAFDYEASQKAGGGAASGGVGPNGSVPPSPKSPTGRASALLKRSQERLRSPRVASLTAVSETGVLSTDPGASANTFATATTAATANGRPTSVAGSVRSGEDEVVESGIRTLYSNRMTTSRNHGPFTPLFAAAGVDVPRALPKPDVGKVKKQFKTVL